METAPLIHSAFMMPRELCSYFSTAYSLRYPEYVEPSLNLAQRVVAVFQRVKVLLEELLYSYFTSFEKLLVIQDLRQDFAALSQKLPESEKPICAYFISSKDHNGALLSRRVYYYHHYKLQQYEQHYALSAKVIESVQEMFDHLIELKREYPTRNILLVDLVCHGSPQSLSLSGEGKDRWDLEDLQNNQFHMCHENATIILDACSSGSGTNSFGSRLASMNAGKTVFAPQFQLFFSKPIIFSSNTIFPTIEYVVHGFSLAIAYTCARFFQSNTASSLSPIADSRNVA